MPQAGETCVKCGATIHVVRVPTRKLDTRVNEVTAGLRCRCDDLEGPVSTSDQTDA
jgi:hypothetical protein